MLVETIKLKNGQTLKVYQDDYAENPRTAWDNLAEFHFFHKRYNFGDETDIDPSDYESWEELAEANFHEDDIVVPVYMYEHSGITISTTPFSCRWDSGQLGFAVISYKKIVWEYGTNLPENREIARRVLEGEVETLDQYLRGEVYTFDLVETSECDLGHEHEEIIESCCGFYGSDLEKNGLYETAGITKEDIAVWFK